MTTRRDGARGRGAREREEKMTTSTARARDGRRSDDGTADTLPAWGYTSKVLIFSNFYGGNTSLCERCWRKPKINFSPPEKRELSLGAPGGPAGRAGREPGEAIERSRDSGQ